MAVFGNRSIVRAQLADPARFGPALDFLDQCFDRKSAVRRTIDSLVTGAGSTRIELAGGAFALVEAYLTRPRSDSRWESHVTYIDIQTIVEGTEEMEVTPRDRMKQVEDLRPGRDVILYADQAPAATLVFSPGDVGVYFPADAHRGALAKAGPVLVRKIVVKVPVPK